jgi:hypothetical protein
VGFAKGSDHIIMVIHVSLLFGFVMF